GQRQSCKRLRADDCERKSDAKPRSGLSKPVQATLPWWKPISAAGNGSSVMCCARKPTSVKQPKWHSLSTSSTACWRWDARATSASYETTRTRDHCVHRLIHATRSCALAEARSVSQTLCLLLGRRHPFGGPARGTGAVYPGHHRRDAGRQEGTGRFHRWHARELTIVA